MEENTSQGLVPKIPVFVNDCVMRFSRRVTYPQKPRRWHAFSGLPKSGLQAFTSLIPSTTAIAAMKLVAPCIMAHMLAQYTRVDVIRSINSSWVTSPRRLKRGTLFCAKSSETLGGGGCTLEKSITAMQTTTSKVCSRMNANLDGGLSLRKAGVFLTSNSVPTLRKDRVVKKPNCSRSYSSSRSLIVSSVR